MSLPKYSSVQIQLFGSIHDPPLHPLSQKAEENNKYKKF